MYPEPSFCIILDQGKDSQHPDETPKRTDKIPRHTTYHSLFIHQYPTDYKHKNHPVACYSREPRYDRPNGVDSDVWRARSVAR